MGFFNYSTGFTIIILYIGIKIFKWMLHPYYNWKLHLRKSKEEYIILYNISLNFIL